MTRTAAKATAPIICAACVDPTRPGLLTCSPRCAITLAARLADTIRGLR